VTLRADRQSAQMSKITNYGLTWSGTGCFIAVPRVVVSFSNVSVSRRFFERLGLVSVSNGWRLLTSRSWLLTCRLHRTSKFKLRTITIKFSILYRDTWAAQVSLNVMDVSKAWFALISASGTLSVFGVGKREPSYSNEGRYSITEHHRLRLVNV